MPSLFEDDQGRLQALVDRLGYDLEPSILIGGWATYLRVRGEISWDIDLIVSQESRHKLQQIVSDLSANNIHQSARKWRGTVDGVHLDIYIPHESQLGGRLRLRVEDLAKHTEPETVGGWRLLNLEAHLVTKIAALLDRHQTAKGEKDGREILALLREGADPDTALRILAEATAGDPAGIPGHVEATFRLLPRLLRLSKADQKFLAEQKRAWSVAAGRINSTSPDRPRLQPRAKDVGQAGNGGQYASRRWPDDD